MPAHGHVSLAEDSRQGKESAPGILQKAHLRWKRRLGSTTISSGQEGKNSVGRGRHAGCGSDEGVYQVAATAVNAVELLVRQHREAAHRHSRNRVHRHRVAPSSLRLLARGGGEVDCVAQDVPVPPATTAPVALRPAVGSLPDGLRQLHEHQRAWKEGGDIGACAKKPAARESPGCGSRVTTTRDESRTCAGRSL